MKKQILMIIALTGFFAQLQANVSLAKIFADNMVLQRNVLIPVWGQAAPNEKITVCFNHQTKSIKANKQGKWMVRLDAEQAGGPFELTVKAKNTIVLKNVLVGEVWLCSGQSNMEWTVGISQNASKEISEANYPFIRQVKIGKSINTMPETDLAEANWQVCDSTSVGSFTGVGYFFAKNLYNELKIPVGIINSSWGGTNIETWISREGFESSDEFKEMIAGMPRLNLDSLSRLKIRASEIRIENLQGTKLRDLNSNLFKELSFNDSKWPAINEPQAWEEQSIGELDGVVWLRKTFDLSLADSKKPTILELSKIDDEDVTYVNGIKVGNTSQWDTKRKYSIPAGVLKEGKNVIAVRVVDNGGGGGIYGDASDLSLSIEQNRMSLAGNWKFQVESIKKSTNENSLPSLCYNSMINPLVPYAIKGVLWYQGESNAPRAYQYRKAFPLLINDWRKKWNQGDFPFYFVQLATYITKGNSNEGCDWAELREAQTLTLKLPNTGMCVTTDIGNPKDIHPTNKQEVGRRLAMLALNNNYNKPIPCHGPEYTSVEIDKNKAVLTFEHSGSGLVTPDNYGYLKGFEIAGNDKVFHFAQAYIQNNKVVVWCNKVENPVAVRFGWIGDASDCNLFNTDGFPAVPFRTDDWKISTEGVKYSFEKLQ